MKYIPADKLFAEIERYVNTTIEAYNPKGEDADFWYGKVVACGDLKTLIASLHQERPEVDFEVKFSEFLERKDAELGAKSWSEEDLRELALYFYYSRDDEQPDVDLDNLTIMKEIKKCGCNPNEFDIARHFYELGLSARK